MGGGRGARNAPPRRPRSYSASAPSPRPQPWKHYIPVNHENLGQRMEWVVNHPKSVERVAAASRIMARTFLTADFLAMYWKQLLDEYARLQRFTVVLPDDACTCWRGDQKKPPPYLPRKTMRCPFLCEVIASA